MTEHKTFPGKTYVVTSKAGCDITDASGELEETCEPGKQKVINAPSDILYTSAPAVVRETFNSAPAKLMVLGLLGGGASSSALPSGYIAADWLGTDTGEAYITVPLNKKSDQTLKIETEHYTTEATMAMMEGLNDVAHVGAYAGLTPGYLFAYFTWAAAGIVVRGDWNTHVVEVKHEPSRQIIYHPEGERVIEVSYGDRAVPTYTLFRVLNSVQAPWVGRKRTWKAWIDGQLAFDLVPAISPDGQTCMYNKVTKEAYSNIGTEAFVVGMSCKQALKLADLPATGGTLTVSLPTSYESDAGVDAALKAAAANGWNITERTHEAGASAVATFGMRRIWVRRTQNDYGMYVDADGKRWQVDWCVGMHNHDGSEPDAHGYELYRNVDAAVDYWELEPWVDPEAEKLLTDGE